MVYGEEAYVRQRYDLVCNCNSGAAMLQTSA